jgi:hypothetical protein
VAGSLRPTTAPPTKSSFFPFSSSSSSSSSSTPSPLVIAYSSSSSDDDDSVVVINPDYKLAAIFLALGALLDTIPYLQLLPGPFVTLLGVLFAVQATRIRFTFDREAFELKIGDDLEGSGENIVVGGENRWNYDSFVNWEFFPEGWIDQPQGPILVYFKETQTPQDQWGTGPGQMANSDDAMAKGAVPGQVHFFPALCDVKQLRSEFQKRGCQKL